MTPVLKWLHGDLNRSLASKDCINLEVILLESGLASVLPSVLVKVIIETIGYSNSPSE